MSTPKFLDAAALRGKLRDAGLPSGNTWLHSAISDGLISPPLKIGGRNYWAAETVEADITKLHTAALEVSAQSGDAA
jgi:hypothetical protein